MFKQYYFTKHLLIFNNRVQHRSQILEVNRTTTAVISIQTYKLVCFQWTKLRWNFFCWNWYLIESWCRVTYLWKKLQKKIHPPLTNFKEMWPPKFIINVPKSAVVLFSLFSQQLLTPRELWNVKKKIDCKWFYLLERNYKTPLLLFLYLLK